MRFLEHPTQCLQHLLANIFLHVAPQKLLTDDQTARKRSLCIDTALNEDAERHIHQYNVLPIGDTHAIRELIGGLKNSSIRVGLTRSERLEYRHNIHQSVATCIKLLLQVIAGCNDTRSGLTVENQHYLSLLNQSQHSSLESPYLNEDIGTPVQALWNNPATQNVFKATCNPEWVEPASYFFSNIVRITAQSYIPTEDDILHSRGGLNRGVASLRFELGDLSLHFLEERMIGERRKWIHQFDSVPVFLFVLDLSTYNQILDGSNSLENMITLFGVVVNARRWRHATFVAVLSHISQFRKKLRSEAFGEYFDNFEGANDGGDEFEEAMEYLEGRLRMVNHQGVRMRVGFVDPGDEGIVALVGDAVRDGI